MTDRFIDISQAKHFNVASPFKGNTHTSDLNGRVSSQWFSRPDDEKFLDLNTLYDYTKKSADNSFSSIVDVSEVQVTAEQSDPDKLELIVPIENGEVITTQPNHYSFGQLCSLAQTPASYLRKLPAALAGINLQYGIQNLRTEKVKTYITKNGHTELRAATVADYGRIFDYEVVQAVQNIAGNGIGDTHWKVPGVLNWQDGTYNPDAAITKESTTLFASDRDIFLFLVDDKHPISIGTYTDPRTGKVEDDLLFRGFYVWNSEVGNRSFGISCFYLRGVCQNRNLWGVEGYQEIRFPHSKNAPRRFVQEAKRALESFADSNTTALLNGINAAKTTIVAKDEDDREKFLKKQGFSGHEVSTIINTVIKEEGHEPKSVWDFVNGITAYARTKGHQDARLEVERRAGRILDKVA